MEKHKDNLAYVLMALSLLDDFMNKGFRETVPLHGIKDLKILSAEFEADSRLFVLLVSSPGISDYLADMAIMEKPLPYWRGLPVITLTFQTLSVERSERI